MGVRRLQELRRYIQQECDQLLMRKEQLKQDINQLDQGSTKGASSPTPSSEPSSLENPYASVTSAYRVILEDISREKMEIEGEAVSFPAEHGGEERAARRGDGSAGSPRQLQPGSSHSSEQE